MKFTPLAAVALATSFALASDPARRPVDYMIVGFENATKDTTIIDNNRWTGDSDSAMVREYAEAPSLQSYPEPFENAGSQFLEIDASSEVTVNPGTQGGLTYIDSLVKFSAAEEDPSASITDAMFILWLQKNGSSYDIKVKGALADYDPQNGVILNDKTYTIAGTGVSIEPDSWHRVKVAFYPQILGEESDPLAAFTVEIDGVEMTATEATYTEAASVYYININNEIIATNYVSLFQAKRMIPATNPAAAITSIGFQGNGAIDDFVVSADSALPIEQTLSWPAGLTGVSYKVDDGEAIALAALDGSATITVTAGSTITLIGTIGYADVTVEGTAAADTSITLPAIGAAYYFANGDGTSADPFQIANVDDLKALRAAVAAGYGASSNYVQTADIDMASAGAFAGIGTYAKVPTAGVPFTGTYNGQNHKISNVTRASGDTQGIFNQVGPSGVIENLVVENMAVADGVTGYGFAIVGNAGGGATLRNLTAMGTFGSATNPSGHNIAGIVVRLSPGATADVATTIDSCTNNATVYGGYTKLGGINAIVQNQTGFVDGKVVFVNCANNGTLVCKRAATDVTGNAGIVGYISGTNVELTGCYSNGNITNADGANTDKDGALVGWTYSGTIKDNGGNSAPANVKMIGTWGSATETGFLYATVANGVATTVLPPLSVGNTYLLEGSVASSEDTGATLASGETISFDTTHGYTFAGNVAAEAPLVVIPSTSGTLITYSTGYFPRTATAGQDGSAEHPFEIADEDDLLALQAAVDANVGRNLCYVQTADIALTAAWPGIGVKGGKDIVSQAAYDNGAFTGVYDGGNYTISNFLMENGTDYGALFNSIYNATIKNLKLSWGSSTLCENSSASGGDTGASFVGVAKASTLQNLTTVAGTVTTVSASKDFGGIVGYLMAGSTVDSCTNALNVASLKGGRKCGGIAIITQGGTGTAVLRNCKNSGTSAGGAQDGGIVGYIGVATEIDGCENTAAVQLFKFQSGSVTASGVNKGNATVRSSDASVAGLRFATVDGDVATFVADNALALNGEYKVMSTGATATFDFTAPGTISFDTALFTPTYAITAAEGLTLTDATEGTVRTYTAAAIVTDESFSDGTTDNAFSIPATTVAELKELCGVADLAATVEGQGITYAQAYALGLIDETTGAVAELPAITIEFENGQPVVKMDGTATDGYTVTCHLYARDSLTVDWGEQPIAYGDYGDDIADPDTSLPAARFYKVKVTIANAQ